MHEIAFLLLLLCAHFAHLARRDNSTDCDGHPCKFGKCVGKKCECDTGFTRRRPWGLYFKRKNSGVESHYDFSCELIMDAPVPGVCSKNATCAYGASCKNDMCTCDEPGWSVGPKGTMYQNICTAGTTKDCKVTTTATSFSKCIRPIFVTCENATGSNSCNCDVADVESKPGSSYRDESRCRLKIDFEGYDGKMSTKTLRLFWKIPGEKPCADELLPEYTCGCKEGTDSCDSIVGAKCSGAPEPDCYVPPGIFCNTTIGICDCDRGQGWIWKRERLRSNVKDICQGIPGVKCRKTEDCVKGSKCMGGKCSPCPGTQRVEWNSAKCVVGLMERCGDGNGDCAQGTECRYDDDMRRKLCHCSAEPMEYQYGHVEYDPVRNECVSTVGGPCDRLKDGYSRNCKAGLGCEYDRGRNRHICVCDQKVGLASYDKFSGSKCLVMHNHPCMPAGIKCLQEVQDYKITSNWGCRKSKDNGEQHTCVFTNKKATTPKGDDFRDNGHRNIIGSIAVIGFGLAVAVSTIPALNC